MKLTLHKHARVGSKEAKAILHGIAAFNEPFGGGEDWRELTIVFKNAKGKVVAGVHGHSDWGWLFVKWLWVSQEMRGKGLGAKLMREAEKEAKKRRCRHIWLDTFSFQAPGFYKKLGYRRFGELNDYPKGYKRFFLTKKL